MARTAVLAIIVLAARAHAQPADTSQRDSGYIGKDIPLLEIDDCRPAPPVPEDQLRRIVSEHYQRGEVLYVQGDYPGAVEELVASYCLIPYYTILKDIGQAYERELDYEKAIAYLQRYALAVPKDAKAASTCAPDPQDDKRNVLARITVLERQQAKILINTEPSDTRITLSNDAGVKALGTSGKQLEVTGGRYQMDIERDGYHPIHREIRAEIGKPYTYFERLEPLMGRLRVRVIPADARLFLDKRQVGTGAFETELPGGRYTISGEAPDHVTVQREVEVLPDRDTPVTFELPAQPEFGHQQLLLFSGIAGAAAGGALALAQNTPAYVIGGIGAGAAAGLFAVYYGTPKDLALGTSSLTVTSSLIGGTIGGSAAAIISSNGNFAAPMIGGGMIVGAGVGYYVGDQLHVRPGEAAIVNSGAVWGSVVGALFYTSFDAGRATGGGLVLSGLGMGTIGGVLITRYFTVSRARAALIDAGGAVGLLIGVATESVISQAGSSTSERTERSANYAIGGLATGLLVTGVLTRHMDEPNLGSVAPVIQRTTPIGGNSTTTYGIGGSF